MLRTHTCGELRATHINRSVTLAGWVQRIRDKGGMLWIDLRDGYGITQLVLEEGKTKAELIHKVRQLGREFVIKVNGIVIERQSKNPRIATGDIEVQPQTLEVMSDSQTPPFTIEDDTDGGEELRMKYRYLDLRRPRLHNNLKLRHLLAQQTRLFLHNEGFIEVETPMLIKSTPEGARDFVVPSRLSQGNFYALPQSPQTFKQLLAISGIDRYFQLVKCFRDEDFRSDRQPEFTQIDCEMTFVEQEDVLNLFERLIVHLFKQVKGISLPTLPRITHADAMGRYGTDKPDVRFEMHLTALGEYVKGKGFAIFDNAESVVGICVKGCASYSRKQLDKLIDWMKAPQIGAEGPLVYARYNSDGSLKSSVDKFYDTPALTQWAQHMNADPGDLMVLLAGSARTTYKAMGALRVHLGNQLNLCADNRFAAVWIVDFPLFEWDPQTKRFYAQHHPFTAPQPEDIPMLDTDPGRVRANAYDMVVNGVEIGGGSIRIHQKEMQQVMFEKLGFTRKEAESQFGFLMEAFRYGAPPHGGIAFGFDRICSLFGEKGHSIKDFIAFPKNNAGRDMMTGSPSPLSGEQLNELGIAVKRADK